MADDDSAEPTSKSVYPRQAALDKAGEFVKYLAALATGALVFSKDLLGKDFTITADTRYFILVAWGCLAFSVVAGIFALGRIPMMMHEGTDDLEDKYLEFPLRAQQMLCFLGVLALGGARKCFDGRWRRFESTQSDRVYPMPACLPFRY